MRIEAWYAPIRGVMQRLIDQRFVQSDCDGTDETEKALEDEEKNNDR